MAVKAPKAREKGRDLRRGGEERGIYYHKMMHPCAGDAMSRELQ